MNTTTHHRFATRLLLLSLTLLTPSVFGSQTPAADSDGSSSADTATCKSPESNLEEKKVKDWIGTAAVKTCFAYLLALFGFDPRD